MDSIWLQNVDKDLYEVICVDDCSTDNTREWLRKQQELHSNLHVVLHDVNKRQGGARNTGMRNALGEYIIFIDQDDYFDSDAFCELWNAMNGKELDVMIVDATYERPGIPSRKLQHNFEHRAIMTGDEQIVKNSLPWAPWKFIFKKSLVEKNNLWFDEKERIEDVDWVHRLTHKAARTQYQPILFIHYIKSDISTTMTSYKSMETIYSTIRCAHRISGLIERDFRDSSPVVKKKVSDVGKTIYHLGVKNLMFCKDSVKVKANVIKANRGSFKDVAGIDLFATKCPTLFSAISNCTALMAPFLIRSYRKFKYRKNPF